MKVNLLDEQADLLYTVQGKVHVYRFSTGEKIKTFGKVPNCSAFLSEDGRWMTLRNSVGLMEVFDLQNTDEPLLRLRWKQCDTPHCAFRDGQMIVDRGASLVAIDLSTGQERVIFHNGPEREDGIESAILRFDMYNDEIIVLCNSHTADGKLSSRTVRLHWPDGKIMNDIPRCNEFLFDRKGGYYQAKRLQMYHHSTFPGADGVQGQAIPLMDTDQFLSLMSVPKKHSEFMETLSEFMETLSNPELITVSFVCDRVVVSPDGRYVAVGSILNNTTRLFDTQTWKAIQKIDLEPVACHFSRMGRYFLISGYSKRQIIPIPADR